MSFSRVAAFGVANLRTFAYSPKFLWKMTTLEEVIGNNQRNGEIIASIKNELAAMRCEILFRRKKALRLENTELQQKVEAAQRQLVALEIANGKKMFAVPSGARSLCTEAKSTPETAPTPSASNVDSKSQSVPKEKKPKKEKPVAAAVTTAAAEVAVDVGRLDMRVGKIVEIGRHPDADSLYLEKIDCGEAQPRTVVSGLVKYVPLEEMRNRMVVVLCNLKPAKMRGVTSEAMVMCASTPEKVEVLSPPAGAEPGDLVNCHGYARQPDVQLNPKKKIFETCAPDLMTNDKLEACYKGAVLHVPGKGPIVSQTLKHVNVK